MIQTRVKFDVENQPGISNLLTIYASLTNMSIKEAEEIFKDYRYGDFKKAVAEQVVILLESIQEKYADIVQSNIIDETLQAGKEKAQAYASSKLEAVTNALGINL